VIVVDDGSTDATGAIARAIAASDPRLRVIESPPLPDDWFGKQWACATAVAVARGELLVFTDADTAHSPELMTRAVNAFASRRADLMSVAGQQELRTFWERVIQPQVFFMLTARYGSTEHVGNARRPEDVIANGQFLMIRRDVYDALGGHAAVRHKVAEDLALGQRFFAAGKRVAFVLAPSQLSTRMYASLGELVRGWRKNVFAGGRDAVPSGARAIFPLMLPLAPLVGLLPFIALVLCAGGVLSGAWLLWSLISVTSTLLWWFVLYGYTSQSRLYALAYPLGGLLFLYIVLAAIVRGDRVAWKGRTYRAA
jgi:chlorobactene glucosyltransferase